MAFRDLPTFRPPKRTVYDLSEAGRVVVATVRAMPSAPTIDGDLLAAGAKALAQAVVETASFASCWWNNWGNLRVPGGHLDIYPFFLNPGKVDEYLQGKRVVAEGEEDELRIFRAFDTPGSGCRAWLELIRSAYPVAYEGIVSPSTSARSFGELLGQPNTRGLRYYTADPVRYGKALEERYPVCLAAVSGKALLPSLRYGAGMGTQEGLAPLVHDWQSALQQRGYYIGVLDGRYGRGTVNATAAWQVAQGIRKDGWCGPFSRYRMGLPFLVEGDA